MRDKGEVRVWPTSNSPPAGLSTGTVCEMMGWSVARLFKHVTDGTVPPPFVYGGRMLWSFDFVEKVQKGGLSIPGTYAGFPPNADKKGEAARWKRDGAFKGRRLLKGKTDRKLAASKRKGGAK